MAQRNSRRGKGKGRKQPELRTGGGRTAKARRSEARRREAERAEGPGAIVRMRPAGPAGYLAMVGVAWLAIAAFALVAAIFERWNIVSYPDSLWLYVAIGTLAVAPAVGRVSRTRRDADSWGAQALLVPAALLWLDAVLGPSCPVGGQCGAIGARGSLGLPLAVLVIALLALATWGLARWQYRVAADRRPQGGGRVRYRVAVLTMVALFAFPGLVLAAAGLGTDLWLRGTPELVPAAEQEARDDCYGLVDAPQLAVRAAPNGYNPEWTTFAVRRANEDRPGVPVGDPKDDAAADEQADADTKAGTETDATPKASSGDKPRTRPLPSNWAELDYVHPYEATVSFSDSGEVVNVTCRRFGPGSGNATADDLVQAEPDVNPLSPKSTGSEFLPRFFTQGVAGPTEEGKKKLADERKADAAAAKAEAANDGDAGEAAADDDAK